MRPQGQANSTKWLLVIALLCAWTAPQVAEGASRRKARPAKVAEPPAAPAAKRVALLAPEDTRKTEAVIDKVLQAAEEDLTREGFQVVTLAKVTAEYRKRFQAVPYCRDTPACLAKVGKKVNAGFVIGAVAVTNPHGVDVELTLVEAATETVVARTALLGVPWTGPLVDRPRPGSAILRYVPGTKPAEPEAIATTTEPPPGPVEPPAPGPGPTEPAKAGDDPAATPEPGGTPSVERPSEPVVEKASEHAGPAAPTHELLLQARQAYDALEFDKAAALASRVLALPGLDADTRLDAYLVQASSQAIAADTQSSEVSFRLLLRARPDFELPRSTPPKILGVFRKVQAEEKAIADQVRSVARRRLVEGLKLVGEPPVKAIGGRPLPFSFRLRDPTSAVTSLDVPYRKSGEGGYSVLALQRDPEGAWKGAIPAEWTASDRGFELEYYLLARDETGPLLGRGGAGAPLRLAVSPGKVERALPKPIPRWGLYTLSAGAAVAVVAAGGLGLATWQAQTDYDRYAQQSVSKPMDGAVLASMGRSGRTLSEATVGMAVVSGLLVAAALATWPFTEASDEGREAP